MGAGPPGRGGAAGQRRGRRGAGLRRAGLGGRAAGDPPPERRRRSSDPALLVAAVVQPPAEHGAGAVLALLPARRGLGAGAIHRFCGGLVLLRIRGGAVRV